MTREVRKYTVSRKRKNQVMYDGLHSVTHKSKKQRANSDCRICETPVQHKMAANYTISPAWAAAAVGVTEADAVQ